MINAVRSEWIKMRTVRMNWVLVIIAIAFPLIVSVLSAALADDIDARDLVEIVQGTSVVTAMLLGVVGASTITGEFGFGTIRVTFAAIPRRTVVVVAKAFVTAVVAMAAEAVVVLLSLVVSSSVASSRDLDVDFGDVPNADAAILGIVLFAAIVSLLGLGLGLLIRNTPAAVAILILWPLVGEGIVGALLTVAGLDDAGKWMPYNEGISMGLLDAQRGDEALSRVGAGLYFFAVTAVIGILGTLLTNRRDA